MTLLGKKRQRVYFHHECLGLLFCRVWTSGKELTAILFSIFEFYQLDFYVKEKKGRLAAVQQFTAGNYHYVYQTFIIPLEVLLFLPESVSFNSQVCRRLLFKS